MDAERANAMHRYFLFAKKIIDAFNREEQPSEHTLTMLQLATIRTQREGVTSEERDALLAIAQHPFASDWARERYGRRQ